jgi:DNA polymerase-3 subunit alpha
MRNGEIEPEYVSDALIDATQDTYGQIIYQEQAMELTRVLAGFDDSMVNKFRKAMGKKVPEDMAAMRTKFVEGCDERDIVKPHESEAIFDMLEEYSGYAFNLSHAVAYSMLTYVCAWLKCEYPMEFVCAQLRSQDDDKKTKALLRDLNAEGYQYVPFDLEKSQEKWAIIDGKVYGKDNWFINLYFEDDSGDCGCTINRFKAAGFQYLLEEDALEKDYLVRADIINDGRKWFFLSKLKELPL